MATCAICKRQPVDPKYKPFCSKRCADIDLQRWFTGGYAIPVRDDEPTDDKVGAGPSRDRHDDD